MANRAKDTYNPVGILNPQIRECEVCSSNYYGKGNSKYCSQKCRSLNEYESNMLKPEWRLGKLLSGAKNRAKTKGLDFDIDLDYLLYLWNSSEGCCEITGQMFDLTSWGGKGQVNPQAPSVDRVIPKLGYTKGNVRLITYHMNISLSDFGTEEFENLVRYYMLHNGVSYE